VGVDAASESELGQTLDRGVPGASIVLTAAVKPASLMALCIQTGVLVVIDNADELALIRQLAHGSGKCASIALRIGGVMVGGTKLASRFGFDIEEIGAIAAGLTAPHNSAVQLHGLHFHLGTNDPGHRIAAIAASVALIDDLRSMGHPFGVKSSAGEARRYSRDWPLNCKWHVC
jgi:diaminopimelate decarboxylase